MGVTSPCTVTLCFDWKAEISSGDGAEEDSASVVVMPIGGESLGVSSDLLFLDFLSFFDFLSDEPHLNSPPFLSFSFLAPCSGPGEGVWRRASSEAVRPWTGS